MNEFACPERKLSKAEKAKVWRTCSARKFHPHFNEGPGNKQASGDPISGLGGTKRESGKQVLVQDWPAADFETSSKLHLSMSPLLHPKARALTHIISEVLSTTEKKWDDSNHS